MGYREEILKELKELKGFHFRDAPFGIRHLVDGYLVYEEWRKCNFVICVLEHERSAPVGYGDLIDFGKMKKLFRLYIDENKILVETVIFTQKSVPLSILRLAETEFLFVYGKPKQAVHRFRNAIEYVKRFKKAMEMVALRPDETSLDEKAQEDFEFFGNSPLDQYGRILSLAVARAQDYIACGSHLTQVFKKSTWHERLFSPIRKRSFRPKSRDLVVNFCLTTILLSAKILCTEGPSPNVVSETESKFDEISRGHRMLANLYYK